MPQALKPLCLIHFWVNPFFSFSALWGNKKWEYNIRMIEKIWDKISSPGSKWSSLNSWSTEATLPHPFLGESLFSFSPYNYTQLRQNIHRTSYCSRSRKQECKATSVIKSSVYDRRMRFIADISCAQSSSDLYYVTAHIF